MIPASGADLLTALTWPSMVIAVQETGLRVLAVNDALAALARTERARLAGLRLADVTVLLPAEFTRPLPQQISAVVASGTAQTFGWEQPAADVQHHVLLAPLRDAAGAVAGILMTSTPTRSTRKTEEAVRAARGVAENARRSHNAFVTNVSHEIRTPIHAILGFADLLHGLVTDGPQLEHVTSIREAGGSLMALLQDVIDLARLEGGALTLYETTMDVRDVVHRAVALHAATATAKGLPLTCVVERAVPPVIGDGARLLQVLSNLVANAVKYTAAGQVSVEARVLRVTSRSADIVIDVTDTGAGIAASERSRIFERFAQLDDGAVRRASGAGLGLSIGRELIEHMGGTLTVSSVRGQGSCFRVSLPDRVVSERTDSSEQDEAVGPVTLGKDAQAMKVLITEDNPVNQRLMVKMLSALGLHADVEIDGRQAIDRCRTTRYDLILMDVAMPDVDGLEATREVRISGQGRPWIVGVSARVLSEDREAAIAAGMDEYLTKPTSLEAIRGAIARASAARARRRQSG